MNYGLNFDSPTADAQASTSTSPTHSAHVAMSASEINELNERTLNCNGRFPRLPGLNAAAATAVAAGNSSSALNQAAASTPTIRLNVGGRSAQISVATIQQRHDSSRLALFCVKTHIQRLTECDSYCDATNSYYFEKSPFIFDYVLGKLHRPFDICPVRVRDEYDFWRISLTSISPCCRFDDAKRGSIKRFSSVDAIQIDGASTLALFDRVCAGKARYRVWQFFENPRSSLGAKIMSVASAICVLVSLSGLILSSMPEFQEDVELMTPHWTIAIVETICMLFFTFEYVARFIVSPQKCIYVRKALNVIDALTILPFFIETTMAIVGIKHVELRNFRAPMTVIRVLRVLRIARIFKLARYSSGLRAFGATMQKSAAELSMLGCFLLTGIMLFSTAIYFFERDEANSKFYSIPNSWWFVLSTMTTVPITPGGKVIAAMASVCGIFCIAFPISTLLDKFAETTHEWKREEEYVPIARPAVLISNPEAAAVSALNNRYKSMRKSKRHVF